MFFQVAQSFFGKPCVSADQLMPGVVPGLPCCVPLTARAVASMRQDEAVASS